MFQLLPSYSLSFSLGSMLGLDWVVGAPEAAGGSLSLWAHSARVASALAAVHLLVPPPCSCSVCRLFPRGRPACADGLLLKGREQVCPQSALMRGQALGGLGRHLPSE